VTLADTPISRLESFLTDSSMTRYVDTVVMRTDDGFRAASADGAVDFREAPDGSIEILAESGDHPLRNQALDQGIGTEAEIAGRGGVPSANSPRPSRTNRSCSTSTPSTHPTPPSCGRPSRCSTTVSGTTARSAVSRPGRRSSRPGPGSGPAASCPSICAPSMSRRRSQRSSAFRPAMGLDGRGRVRSGARLAMQDGDEITELLDPDERPDHVVVFLWDGVNPNALHDAVDRGEAPGIASLIERGTSYRHGCISALPTATLANHTTQCTGVFPGRSGVLHNTWYDRNRGVHVDLLDYHQMIRARDHLAPGVETIHEALKRHEPEAFTATTYEYGDRGADYSTYAQMTTNGPIPTLSDADRRLHRTEDFMGVKEFRNASIYDAHSRNELCMSGGASSERSPATAGSRSTSPTPAGTPEGRIRRSFVAAIRDT
jgi:hypothetical protein